jgi:hypothetical protein
MQAEATSEDSTTSVAPGSAQQTVAGVVANSDVLTLRDVKTFAVGFSSYWVFAWLFDYPLFGAVVWQFGPIWGGLIMLVLTLLVDIGSIRFYDWSKRDWLAVEFIRSHKGYAGRNPVRRLVKFVLTKTPKVLQVMLLSLRFNAFIVTTLLRDPASSFNGLSRSDWGIFALSFVTAQLYWTLVIYGGIQGLELLFS